MFTGCEEIYKGDVLMVNKELILSYMIDNHEAIKVEILGYKQRRQELYMTRDPVFYNDIKKKFKQLVSYHIAAQVAYQYGLSTEEVLIVLEDVNLEEYLE